MAEKTLKIEILSQRGERHKHFDLGNGLRQFVGFTAPIHFKNAQNDWEDIVLDFQPDGLGNLLIDKNKVSCGFRTDKKLEKYFGLRYDYEHQFEATISKIELDSVEQLAGNVFEVAAEVKTKQAISNKLNANVEIINRLSEVSLKNYFRITNPIEDFKITEELHLKGLSCSNKKDGENYIPDEQGIFNFVDEKGEWKFGIRQPFFVDADRKFYPNVQHELKEVAGRFFYTKTPTAEGKDDLILAKFPIEIDADTFYSLTADGYIYNAGSSWADCHDAVTGDSINNTAGVLRITCNGGKAWGIDRAFLFFDTSTIGAGQIVTDVVLSLYGDSGTGGQIGQAIQKGTQASPITTADFDSFAGTAYITREGWLTNDQYTEFILGDDSADQACIDVEIEGTTKYCVRNYANTVGDYPDADPGANNYETFWSSEETETGERRPRLVVTYEAAVSRKDLQSKGNVKVEAATYRKDLSSQAGLFVEILQDLKSTGSISAKNYQDLKSKASTWMTFRRGLQSLANIQVEEIEGVLSSRANIKRGYNKDLKSQANLWKTIQKDLKSKAEIFQRISKVLQSKANIKAVVFASLESKANVAKTAAFILESKANLVLTQFRNLFSKADIKVAVVYRKDLESKGCISVQEQKDLQTKAWVKIVEIEQDLKSRANLWKAVYRDLKVKGNLVVTIEKDLGSKADIFLEVSRDLGSQANLFYRVWKDLKSKTNIKIISLNDLQSRGSLGIVSQQNLRSKAKIRKTYDTGWKSPTQTGGIHNEWTNPTNAYSSNNEYAVADAEEGEDNQSYDTFHFAIPEGAIIDGIEVRVEAKTNDGMQVLVVTLYCKSDSDETSSEMEEVTTTESIITYGGSTDKWRDHPGEGPQAWVASDFSDVNFYLHAQSIDLEGDAINVDHIQVKVYYTIPDIYQKDLGTKGNILVITKKDLKIQGNLLQKIRKDLKTQGGLKTTTDQNLKSQADLFFCRQNNLKNRANIIAVSYQNLGSKANLFIRIFEGLKSQGAIKILAIEQILESKANIWGSVQQNLGLKGNLVASIQKDLKTKANMVSMICKDLQSQADLFIKNWQDLQTLGNIWIPSIERDLKSKASLYRIAPTALVSPLDEAVVSSPVILVWEIPVDSLNRNIVAHIQIDKTDETFNDLEKELLSYRDSGFEFWDGGSWEPYPVAGVDPAYYGNQARISVILLGGTKFWRVKGCA